MKKKYDFLIVGAGFSGLVFAQQASSRLGATCLVVDKREHIGGNAYDSVDDNGVLIHQYGPHYFRTNSKRIRSYLDNFTEWHPVDYKINVFTRDRFWNFPINLNTFEQLIGRASTSEEFQAYLEEKRIPIENPSNSEEVIISQVGRELYEMFFEGYTLKQWKRHPRELDASVCGRIPIRLNRDDRYLREEFQALPKHGYTAMFTNMIKSMDDLVDVELCCDFERARNSVEYGHLIYTGQIDSFYGNCFGQLPYRSLRFEREAFSAEQLESRENISGHKGLWQPALQVNYPGAEPFTRIVELKHATGQDCPGSTIVREYPMDYVEGSEPYYPVPNGASQELYKKYEELAKAETRVSFIGRLATYRYFNMDQVVGMALAEFEKIQTAWNAGKIHRTK